MFGTEVDVAARAHALADHPHEACGIVVGDSYLALPNNAENKSETFALPEDTFARYEVRGVVHSHCAPRHQRAPSASDMRGQIDTAVPWGIVLTDGKDAAPVLWWGDQVLDQPIMGRRFVHGVTDCYGLVRAWFWQHRQAKLADVVRDDNWWLGDGDLFRQRFVAVGFAPVDPADADVGDVMLIRLPAHAHPHHCGVIVDRVKFLHHPPDNMPKYDLIGRWRPYVTHWLRRICENEND